MDVETATGSIARAARVLSAIAHYPEGASLSEVVARTDFSKTTAHRVLTSLQEVRYVAQDPGTRRYRFGAELAALARDANLIDITATARRAMRRLADETEDTVFLCIPEGAASICLHREIGAFPIRTLTLDPGTRHPLGVGAAAQAIMGRMAPDRRMAAHKLNHQWLEEFNMTADVVEALLTDDAARGYALNPGRVIPGMAAVGLPVVTGGRTVAAISIGAISDRMTPDRIEKVLVPALRRETDHLAGRFASLEPGAQQ